jgi:hypothetical protein
MTTYAEPQYGSTCIYVISTIGSVSGPAPESEPEPCFSPKYWAQIFREFLFELYGWSSRVIARENADRSVGMASCPRKYWTWRLPTKREWIFKDWVQKLYGETLPATA